MTPSSPGIITAALISSLQPSNLANNEGFFVVQNLSFNCVAGFISAAISVPKDRQFVLTALIPDTDEVSTNSYKDKSQICATNLHELLHS